MYDAPALGLRKDTATCTLQTFLDSRWQEAKITQRNSLSGHLASVSRLGIYFLLTQVYRSLFRRLSYRYSLSLSDCNAAFRLRCQSGLAFWQEFAGECDTPQHTAPIYQQHMLHDNECTMRTETIGASRQLPNASNTGAIYDCLPLVEHTFFHSAKDKVASSLPKIKVNKS